MTREEAKKLFKKATYTYEKNTIVELIYNDFENRTCENCKYWSQEKEFPRYCELLDVDIDECYKDFGCSKFVSTDTKSPQQD